MLKKFVYGVNAIPFSGKVAIRPFAQSYWTASSSEEKRSLFLALLLLLGIMIVAHGYQAFLGFKSINQSDSIVLNAIFTVYGFVNLAVVIAQIHLLCRATRHLTKKLSKTKRKIVESGCGSARLHLVVTLLGQVVFLVAYVLARI